MKEYKIIRKSIERVVSCCPDKSFIIYPFGEFGAMTKWILNNSFCIKEALIVDNNLSQFNPGIKNLEYCKQLNKERYIVLLACKDPALQQELYDSIKECFPVNSIINILQDIVPKIIESPYQLGLQTIVGKYSYGPLCNHPLVKSVGAFCSFAPGTEVVENHPIEYISTHPFVYYGGESDIFHIKHEELSNFDFFFPGIKPKGKNYKLKRITIGNDVWLGKNVTICNSSNIGNGVIVGAGAVITKDIPDYAVVTGMPAKIIRYRYSPKQIEALNAIAWWDWEDKKIRECYDDFFDDIDNFIYKHL